MVIPKSFPQASCDKELRKFVVNYWIIRQYGDNVADREGEQFMVDERSGQVYWHWVESVPSEYGEDTEIDWFDIIVIYMIINRTRVNKWRIILSITRHLQWCYWVSLVYSCWARNQIRVPSRAFGNAIIDNHLLTSVSCFIED